MLKTTKLLSILAIIVGVCLTILRPVDAAKVTKPVSVACSISLLFEFRAQDGTLLSSQLYQKDFVVQEGHDFIDDFSTPTRSKTFTASLHQVGTETSVSFNFFSDVSVFDSIDESSTLTLASDQKRGTIGADHTFSSTPGHSRTTYTLVGIRN